MSRTIAVDRFADAKELIDINHKLEDKILDYSIFSVES